MVVFPSEFFSPQNLVSHPTVFWGDGKNYPQIFCLCLLLKSTSCWVNSLSVISPLLRFSHGKNMKNNCTKNNNESKRRTEDRALKWKLDANSREFSVNRIHDHISEASGL